MQRRIFFRNMLVSGIPLIALPVLSCQSPGGSAAKASADPLPEIDELTVVKIQEMVAKGQLTYLALTRHYLKQIAAVDKAGPTLNAVIETNPDAENLARQLDEERKAGHLRGPLHGIPILIKDNIDTADQMQTTAGSLALAGHHASRDAYLLGALREAGVILLGKTNLSEWANFRSTRSISGWSSRGGQTRNPYVLDRNPCGSSSGSAVAVSANLCMLAIGTETDGSIACPASMNGVVGIKPTVGLVSRSGIIPISSTQDTAGPMARTVTDAALLLSFLAKPDPKDAKCDPSVPPTGDYTRFLKSDGLKGKRIGIEKSYLHHHEGVDAILRQAISQLEAAGAVLVEVEFMDKTAEYGKEELIRMKYEFRQGLNDYLASAGAGVKSLADVIRFNRENEAAAMPWFKQEILEASEQMRGLDNPEYLAANRKINELKEFIDKLLQASQLDALCGPASGTAWCTDPVNGDFWTGYGAYTPAAILGYPSITVPMGLVRGLPIGLSFFGKSFSEPALLAMAYAYEQHSNNRVKPNFLPTLKS
ncbi:MAG: amidase [Marinilabiliales bacterium]|nr:amidase [Marinilabiliales bacterium]